MYNYIHEVSVFLLIYPVDIWPYLFFDFAPWSQDPHASSDPCRLWLNEYATSACYTLPHTGQESYFAYARICVSPWSTFSYSYHLNVLVEYFCGMGGEVSDRVSCFRVPIRDVEKGKMTSHKVNRYCLTPIFIRISSSYPLWI